MTDHTTILGIETSCDETAAAVVRSDGVVLSNVVASQIATHAPYGGVVPELASRAHVTAVVPVIRAAIDEAGGMDKIDAIAVTHGPGLVGALLVGIQTAKTLAFATKKPLVGVNHLDGHLLAAYLRLDGADEPPEFPFIGLLVSGGHTAVYRVDSPLERELLGQTRDDAAGEAFDKAAKLLGLAYPGGPAIDRLAQTGDDIAHTLPMPMLHRPGFDFSFSGLKTAMVRWVAINGVPEDPQELADIAASLQRSLVEVLARKSIKACKKLKIPRLVLGGGVAANTGLRARTRELAAKSGIEVFIPPLVGCTDNAAMIAYAGAKRYEAEGALPFRVFSRDPGRIRGRFRPDGTLVPKSGQTQKGARPT